MLTFFLCSLDLDHLISVPMNALLNAAITSLGLIIHVLQREPQVRCAS